MSHPNPVKGPPPAKAKGAPAKGGPPPPPGGAARPAGRGGAMGGGGGGGGSAAASRTDEGLCPSCHEPAGGQKFCPKCGTLQPGAGGAAAKILSPRSGEGIGRFNIDFPRLKTRFEELCQSDTEHQTEVFLKAFIMALGDDWKLLLKLQAQFTKMLRDEGESDRDMNEVQAMSFLQKNGAERTSTQRREEVRDVDLDNNQRICFIEYLLLHFKVMILTEFYKRHECEPEEDLTKGGVGVTGVGPKLLDQLFTTSGGTLSPELEKAIEDFTTMMRARNQKLNDLQAKSKGASVKAMAAANEIKQMENEDLTEVNRMELTLNAAKKKALKGGDGAQQLEAKKKAELKEEEAKRKASRDSLRERAALWK